MHNVFKQFYERHFTNPEAVALALFLVIISGLVMIFGEMLASVITALVIAFVLEWLIKRLEAWHMPRFLAVCIVYIGFIALLVLSLLLLLPLLWQQTLHLIEELPHMFSHWEEWLLRLPQHYPHLFTQDQIKNFINNILTHATEAGQHVLSYSTAVIPLTTAVIIYIVLVPLMIFFMLKDRDLIANWFAHFLPAERGLIKRVWDEVYEQLGNYVRGKVAEIIIVGVIAWIIFAWMGLHYAALLGVIVGISVIVPYVGPTLAIIPLAFVGFFEWGFTPKFIYLMVGYVALQAFDGNILIPLLFSEVVNLHPLAIIIAVIFFGSLWGFWGVFFAIPLGILIKAVLNAWPAPVMMK